MGRRPKPKPGDAPALVRVPWSCRDAWDVLCNEYNTSRSKLLERWIWKEFERLEREKHAQLPLKEQRQLTLDDALFNLERLKAVVTELDSIMPGIFELD